MTEHQELKDWNQLFLAVTMSGLDEQLRTIANIPSLWPNEWHQDCAMVAFLIHGMRERMKYLATILKACPHAKLTYNDDPDFEDEMGLVPVGYSLRIHSCSSMTVASDTLEGLLDLAMRTEPDEDGNVEANNTASPGDANRD